jgi:hypothetical protein
VSASLSKKDDDAPGYSNPSLRCNQAGQVRTYRQIDGRRNGTGLRERRASLSSLPQVRASSPTHAGPGHVGRARWHMIPPGYQLIADDGVLCAINCYCLSPYAQHAMRNDRPISRSMSHDYWWAWFLAHSKNQTAL